MKKRAPFWKRALGLLTVSALIVSFSGCTGSPSGTSTSSMSTSSQKTPESGGTSSAFANTAEAIGFEPIIVPFPDEPLASYPVENGGTISIWMYINSATSKYYQNLVENPTVKQMIKDTGINVEFIHPPTGQTKENFNLLVVSDSLPDLLVNANQYYAGGDVAAVADGVFADLTELVPEYAPDYYYFIEKNELFRKLATTTDSKIYSIYNYKDVQAPYFIYPQFREDWLKEWNMEIPFTLDEYEAYFEKVLAEKPGIAPYLPSKNGLEGELLGAFGIGGTSNGVRYFVKDGKVRHTFNEPAFKDYLTLMNDWYNKGYISKDFTNVESIDAMNLEFANGRTGMVFGNTDTIFTLMSELDFEATTGRYPRINAEDPYHFDIFYFPQNGNPNAISAKSKNKELALQFLNYSFTQQGSGVANFGETGVTWNMGDDGIPVFTDYALSGKDYSLSDSEYTLRLHTCWAKYRYGDDISMIRNVAEPDTWKYRARWADDETVDGAYAMPTLSFTTEASAEIGKLTTDINTYAEEMILKFITGAASLDQFDEFQKNVQSLGMDRVLELYQQAYEQFLAK